MIYNANELRKETVQLIHQIDFQIEVIEKRAKDMGLDPHVMQDTQGYWPMVPLLAAKASAYNTLVMLQTQPSRR